VFEGKPLSEMTYQDLEGFLRLRRAEGEDLDYKQEWDDKIVRTICAMANTAGGNVLVGVKEKRDGATKTNRPDPDDVPGIQKKPADLAQSVAAKVRSRTRPPLAPEAETVEVPGGGGKVVLMIRVAESPDAPHEVRHGPSPELLVRRRDNTEGAGVDDVERLIYRRDALRRGAYSEALAPSFFERMIAPRPDFDLNRAGFPKVAVAIRPRRTTSLGFDFSRDLDESLMTLAQKNKLLGASEGYRPDGRGAIIEYPGGGVGFPSVRTEVRKTGVILSARALEVTSSSHLGGSSAAEEVVTVKTLSFDDVVSLPIDAVRFAAAAYAARKPGVEIEVCLGFSDCQGYRLRLRPHRGFGGAEATMPSGPHYPSIVVVRAGRDGEADSEDLLALTREASRAFGVRAPDEELSRYLA
jgi:hypothetical protein